MTVPTAMHPGRPRRVLIANRGAVAARVLRALRTLGIESVAVFSDADRDLPYLADADHAVHIGPAPARLSYLDQERLIQAALETGADAIHPGYGFLSENAGFAERVAAAGFHFIGPSPRWIRALGHKTQARALMADCGMPQAPSSPVLPDEPEQVAAAARAIGFPVLVKPAGGGGGIGMLPAHDEAELAAAWIKARSISQKSFATAELYLEKLISAPRHIEFQVLADRYGGVRILFERDCSVQRRHQKVIEEARAPGIESAATERMSRLLADLLAGLGYDVIGTVEMLYTAQTGFVFLEMNTRLQVEHAVTEEVTGIDIVASQIRLASGERIADVLPQPITAQGHAIEARIYAEDPVRFLPSAGRLESFVLPSGPGVRIETGYRQGAVVTPHYDPMIAKVIASAPDRPQAIRRLHQALSACDIQGVRTNIPFILKVLDSDDFNDGRIDTGLTQRLLARTTEQREPA
ncbi:acetyl-CoA carboxylase biotin carboxylase subunit [Noviherbaspirillum sp.]|uniref:acetyl-CoA carboxylase biotin carboxylase subunit n=1 Tax=Noviherbaspirillum sp. TaxID=1926288 RepID=UPI002FE0CCB1